MYRGALYQSPIATSGPTHLTLSREPGGGLRYRVMLTALFLPEETCPGFNGVSNVKGRRSERVVRKVHRSGFEGLTC